MNTTDNPQHIDPARPDPARLLSEETRERPEPVEVTSTPEAVRADVKAKTGVELEWEIKRIGRKA